MSFSAHTNGAAHEGFRPADEEAAARRREYSAHISAICAEAFRLRDNKYRRTYCASHELDGEEHGPSCDIRIHAKGRPSAICRSRHCPEIEKTLLKLGMLPKPRVIASYLYESETGEPIFYVDKWDPKAFTQRNANGKRGRGSMAGVMLVPFMLPEWLTAPHDKWRLGNEGEAGTLCAVGLGFVATNSPGGAGKFKSEYAQYFADTLTAIIVDNDEPGRGHAREWAKTILPTAAGVKLIYLPDIPQGGDLRDYVAAGGTREQLDALIEAAPLVTAADVAPTPGESAGDQSYAAVKARMDELFAVDTVTHEIFDQRTGETVPPYAFDKIAASTFHHSDPDKGSVPTAPRWRADGNRTQRAGRVWLPGEPNPTCRNEFNLFKPLPGVTIPISLDDAIANLQTWYFPLRDHVYSVRRECQYFEQLIALKRQNPAFKVPVGIMLWGDPGAGKSLLFEVLGSMLFGDYFSVPDANQLKSNFNASWCARKLIVLCEEIVSSDKRADQSAWKHRISEARASLNAKFKQERAVTDYLMYWFTTNHPDSFPFDADDRRFFVSRCAGRLDDAHKGLGLRIYRMLHPETAIKAEEREAARLDGETAANALRTYFDSFNDFDGLDLGADALMTDAKREMIVSQRSDLGKAAHELVEEARERQEQADEEAGARGEQPKPCPSNLLIFEDSLAAVDPYGKRKTAWRKALENAGVRQLPHKTKQHEPRQVRVGTKTFRPLAIINYEFWNNADNAVLAEAISSVAHLPKY